MEDCEVYIDPEEDEVFFGNLSEKEQNLFSKLGKSTGLNSRPKDDRKLDEYACGDFNIENVNKNVDGLIIKNSEEILKKEELDISHKGSENATDPSQDLYSFYPNASVELEHNYSTPMKNKIDKTILSTPKSVVKADRDGGFLKVLSEIALVKAEADADKKNPESEKEDEDKENKIIPEIRVTEATPEKASIISPPNSMNKQLRRFRIIYNSPNNEENSDTSKPVNTKSESFEMSQNLKNKSLQYDSTKVAENILNNDKRKSVDCCNQSINLIDLNRSNVINENEMGDDGAQKINEGQLLKNVSEIDELLSLESKESEEVNELVEIEKGELVLVDNKNSREDNYVVKDAVKAPEEEHKLVLGDKENLQKMDQSIKTEKEEHESVFLGNKHSREENYSVKETVQAQEDEFILMDNNYSKVIKLEKQATESQKETCNFVLVNNIDLKEVIQSVKETVEAHEEEQEIILINNNISRELIKEMVKPQKEEHELDKKDSQEVDQSHKEAIKLQEEPEIILINNEYTNQKDDLLIEKDIKEEKSLFLLNKHNEILNVSQTGEKKEPELMVLDEDLIKGFESFDKHIVQINSELDPEEKLEAALVGGKSEETSIADPGEDIQKLVGEGSKEASVANPDEDIQKLEGGESEETLKDTIASEKIQAPEVDERVEATSNIKGDAQKSEEQLPKVPGCRRFSKDARMIVDVLKKSIVEDSFNFTIQEMDAENVENSFLSPETVTCFDETVIPGKLAQTPKPAPKSGKSSPRILLASTSGKSSPRILPASGSEKCSPRISPSGRDCKSARKATTVEKGRPHLAYASIKYFSHRKIYNNQNGGEVKECVKKLPFDAKKIASEEKMKVSKAVEKGPSAIPTSRIPLGGVKISKIPTTERTTRPALMKNTPLKTPTTKTYKNPKFNNIESPLNAYINNKPTSLVLNVKPETKKDTVSKVWKAQTTGSSKKIPERTMRAATPITGIRLPFVEYRSATPYKVEKRPESKLPRLAPTVQKLIGSHSPRVLKHEGRFYLKTPKKPTSVEDTTILADPNEVSVVVCQTAQKSKTIK